jgi:DNA relaxase NicK
MTTHLKAELISVGVDYLTVTATGQTLCDLMRARAFGVIESELANGFFGRPWRLWGYEGVKVGAIEYGERLDGCIVRMHDVVAASHWRRFYDCSSNCSRIDLQCTFQLDRPVRGLLTSHLKEMRRRDRKRKGKPQTSHQVCRRGGLTVCSGSRTSSRFFRGYDKGIQSGLAQYQNCIRYEGEFKHAQAKHLAAWLIAMKSEHVACGKYVCQFASDRGVNLRSLSKVFHSSASIDAGQLPGRLTDLARSQRWLGKSVKPTVRLMCERIGRVAVERILGLC